MKKIVPIIIGLFVIVGGFWAYNAVLGETEEASGPIVAESIVQATDVPATAIPEPSPVPPTSIPDPTTAVAEPTDEPEPTAVVVEPTAIPELTAEPVVEEVVVVEESAPTLFTIDQTQSTASFALDEDLLGERVTVIGVTDQVAAEISFDVANPSAAQVGPITINARTLTTDNDRRNRAMGNRILRTAEFEFIRFVPTALNGLPDSVTLGETVTFDIVGELTVMDVTLPVTFKTAVTPTSATELTGTATATILYQDFGIPIPTAPVIANVEEELELMLDFVAVAQ